MRFARWALVSVCPLLVGTSGAVAASRDPGVARPAVFYVGSHGWHTSIVVPRAQIPAHLFPRGVTERTFLRARYLEISWGDRKFYTAPKPNALMALDAVFLPGPSVLHIAGVGTPLADALPWSALVRVPCTRAEFAHLCGALGDSFARDGNGAASAIGPGLYGETSRFYPARGRYYLLNTCDTWTARAMRAGGLLAETCPVGTWSAGAVIEQARRLTAARQSRAKIRVRFRRRNRGQLSS